MFKTKEVPAPAPAPVLRSKPVAKAAAIPSIISADMTIHGNLHSVGDLQVEGEVVGDIEVEKLLIAAGGTVIGHVIATEVRICGCLTGSVRSDTVTLAATAVVVGDSYHRLLTIETGATLEGQSRRLILQDAPGVPASDAAPREAAPAAEPEQHEPEQHHEPHHHDHGEQHQNGEYHQH